MKPYTGQVITDNETGEGQGLKPYDGEVISPGQEPKKPGAIRKNAQDLAVSFTGSAANLLGALAQAGNVVTGGELDRRVVKPLEGGARAILGAQPGARGIAGMTQDANEALEQYKSPELRQAQQEQAQIEGFLPSAANVLTSPRLAVNMLAEQGPILALMGRNARSASRRGQADVVARNPNASAAEILAGGQTAAQGSLVRTGAAMGGGYASNEAVQRALQLPDSVWEANPEYQALIEAGVDAQAAKEKIATSAALPSLLTGAGVNAAAMQLTKGLEARVFTGNAAPAGVSGLLSKEGAKAVGKAVALEAAEEGITEGGEQFGSNLGVRQIDPNQDLLEGVPEGAGAGAALGGLLGGSLQVAGSALSKPAEPGREEFTPPPAAPPPVDVQPGPGQTIVDPKDGPLSKAVAVAAAPDAAPAPVVVPDVAAQAQAEQDRQQAEEDQKAALKDAPAAAARTTEDATAIATGQPKKPGAREPATADEIMQALAPWNGKLMDASTQVMLARALNVPVAEVQKARAAQRQAELAAKSSGTAATATPTMPAAGSAANEEGKVIRERSDEDAAGRAGGRPDEAAQGSEGQDGQADPQGQARPVSADRKLLAALKTATSGKGADGAEYAVRAFSNGDGFYVTRKTETGSTRHQSTDPAKPWSYEQAAREAAQLAGARKEGSDGQDSSGRGAAQERTAGTDGAAQAAQVAAGDAAPAPVRAEQGEAAGSGAIRTEGSEADQAGDGTSLGEAGGRNDVRGAGAEAGAEAQADIERVAAGVRGLEPDANGLIEVRDVYGEVHRVKKADIEAGNKVLLRRYGKDGQPAKKGGSMVNIGNLDPDGSLLAAQNAESPPILITTRGGTSKETSGFKGVPALNKAIRKQGLDPADYTPRQVAPGRYVGERKRTAAAKTERQSTAEWAPLSPDERAAMNELYDGKKPPKASANTIFTEDAYLAAKKLLKSKLGQLNSGIDPEMLQAGITAAGYHIEKGARTFAAYTKAMLADLGDAVRPYLKSWYLAVKFDPRAAAFEAEMDDPGTVSTAQVDRRGDRETRQRLESLPEDQRDAEIRRLRDENAQLRAAADLDARTGIKNPGAYDRDIASAGGVAAVDLTLFKGYNTLLTDAGGDAVLAAFGQAMKEVGGDAAYRRGGDEFAFLTNTPAEAQAMLDALRERAGNIELVLRGSNGALYTVSGVPFAGGVGTDEQTAVQARDANKAPGDRNALPPNVRAQDAGRGAEGGSERQDRGRPPAAEDLILENDNEPANAGDAGASAPAEVPAEAGRGTAPDEAAGDADPQPGRGRDGRVQAGGGDGRRAARGRGIRAEGGAADAGAEGRAEVGGRRTGRKAARVPEERGADAVSADLFANPERSPAAVPAANFRITDEVELGQGGEATKFKDNLAAIRILKELEREGRRATPDEQRALARYVGWGGLANAFRNPVTKQFKPDWEARGTELEALLTPDELKAARRSTRNAHYTSEAVVNAMWSAVERLGYRGGMALEPSSGTGNFIGLVPERLGGATKFIGIEYDSLTARIAGALYPQSAILHTGFQKAPLPDGAFDLVIGNPPFGNESLKFQYKPELNGQSIHNQFFLGGLDALRENGIMAMVVSRYLMDAKTTEARKMMAAKAELLGAIRLPETAFKGNAGTEVVTDILFFRKFDAAEAAAAEQEIKDGGGPDWIHSDENTSLGEPFNLNRYFAGNPQAILGTMSMDGKMQQGPSLTVRLEKGEDLADRLAAAVEFLPKGAAPARPDAAEQAEQRFDSMVQALKIGLEGREAGSIRMEGDRLVQVFERETPEGEYELATRDITPATPWSRRLMQDSQGRYFELVEKLDADGNKVKDGRNNVYERKVYEREADIPATLLLGESKFERLKAMVRLRDILKRQLTLEAEDAPAAQMDENRADLNEAYDDFVKRHGLLSLPKNAALVNDMPDGALVQALETGFRPEITAAKAKTLGEKPRKASADKAAIFSRRVVPRYEPPTSADSPADALAITLSESGRVDVERIASLLGTDKAGAEKALSAGEKPLAFFDPEEQAWVTADAYLSGNVRRKLQAARAADGLAANVAALEAVQPERWGAESVTVHLGASWVPPKIYADFLKHLVGGEATAVYSRATNTFGIQERGADRNRSLEWGTEDYPAPRLLEAILNSRGIRVTRRTADDKTYVDEEATALAQLKAKQMANEFADWVFMDGARREQLVELFNDKFNTRVTRQNDGSHLKLPGKVPDAIIKMRRHQNNAIWRGILDRFVLYDHAVGAGKTFTGIARAMERRRMGLSKKPMIVVPNHMVEQFTGDAYKLYPGAKILAAGREDFERSRRRKLFAKIATGDWDLIIVPHSSFGFISLSPETEARYLEREIALAEEAIKEAKEQAAEEGFGGFGKPITVKEAERLLVKLENRLSGLGKKKQDRLLTFEQMGVDDLTVDEAHEFKNLFYTSRLQGVRGMGDKSGSQKAFDLYNKVRYLRETKTGSVAFMTGTPISNSAVEMFTMMRYLAADELAELGLENFDAWRAQFVEADTKMEPTESGRLKEVNRLGRTWSNMRSLMELYYSFTDAVSNDDIKRWYAEDNPGKRFPIPDVEGGDRQRVIVKPTEAQDEMLKQILADFDGLDLIRDPKERNAQRLRLMDRARKLSLDIRAVDPFHPSNESGGKLEKVAEQVAAIYRETAKDKGTQLIFLDRSVPKAKGDDKIIKAWEKLEAERDRAARIGDEDAYREAIEAMESFTVSGANYRAEDIQAMRESQRGGWNAYQQIKDNLVAQGIPENEIRFVQEANNDAQKQALFDAVKAGEVRILLGSTPRMGAGTNVQDRLVALHHVDVTWKPSDIEQREGRIIRQGNKLLEKYGHDNFKVRIFAYATERTVDAKMWDLNATKLKTINGIRKYDGAFTMDFNDDDAVGMAEMAALASGDPKLLERVQLQADLDKLDLLKRAHNRKMFGLKDRLHRAERTIETYPARIERAKANRAALEAGIEAMEAGFDARSVTVEGKAYTSRGEAVQAAYEAMDAQRDGKDRGPFTLNIAGEKVTTKEGIEAAIGKAMGDAQAFEATIKGTTHIQRTAAGAAIALEGRQMEPGAEKRIGTMFGLPLKLERFKESLTLSLLDADGGVMFEVEGNNVPGAEFSVQYARGLITSLDGRANPQTIASDIRFMERTLAEAREDLPNLQAQQDQPFAQAQEMADKMARLEQLTRELSGKSSPEGGAEPEGAASLPDGDRPTGPSEFSIGVNDLRRAMDRIVRGWKGDAPTVKYIQSATELPAAAKRGDRWFDAEGWYDGTGTIWLVADNLPNITRAEQVLAHEAFGHYGVEGVVAPGDWARIVADVAKLRSSTTLSAEVKAAMNSAERRYGTENPVQFAREFLAIMAERGIRSTLLGRVLAAVRRWARALGFRLDRWAEQDLRELVARGMRSVERGGETGPRRGRGAAFSDRAPVFYSALLETVQRGQGSPKRGDAAAWKSWLDGAQRRGEFRQSERDWLGVDAWLDGRGATTREELADFIRANQVQVEEVVLGGDTSLDRAVSRDLNIWMEHEGIDPADTSSQDGWNRIAARLRRRAEEASEDGDEYGAREFGGMAVEAERLGKALGSGQVAPPVRYESFQLPGGENYRELLLTLPEREESSALADEVEQERLANGESARYWELVRRQNSPAERGKDYRSSHFDQPNILAHVRFNERTDVDGKRVLFIEEIQSDWHQAGRKKGYGPKEVTRPRRQSMRVAQVGTDQQYTDRNGRTYSWGVFDGNTLVDGTYQTETEAQERLDEMQPPTETVTDSGVPDAPFKATDEWAMLAFKRMARWAVDNGFDRIAWTTGEQQAERYKLSHHISAIASDKTRTRDDGSRSVFIDVTGKGGANLLVDANGIIQNVRGIESLERVAGKPLDEVVGKPIAEQIMAAESPLYIEGVDLDIGGEGMRAFYDKILPAAVKKWGKKFGATVGKTEIVPSAMLPHNTKRQPVSVHSIDVTDAMRDAVAQGQPAFSLRDPGAAVDRLGAALAAKPTEILKNKLSDIRPALLGLLTLDQLAEISKDETPQVRNYAKRLLKMQTRRNQLQESAGRIADDWQKWQGKNRAEAEKLAGLMHDATIAGTDPAEPFQHGQFAVFTGEAGSLADDGKQVTAMLDRLEAAARQVKDAKARREALAKVSGDRKRLEAALAAEKKREDAYPGLVARFNALSDKAKDLYRTVRDEYANRSEATMVALLERVGALGIPSEQKASLSDKIRTMFESGRVSAPYFPLARFGEYWVSAKITLDGGEEETAFYMAETAAERDKLVDDLKREGWTIAARGVKLDNVKAKDGASGTFVAQVIEQLNLAGVDDAVQDEIYQLYLRTLPDLSVRKNFIHRKKVKGYANDALRAFAAHMNHGAHQLARLENGRFLEAELDDLRKAAKDAANEDDDAADRIGRMFNEMQKRHEWVMNPRDSALVQKVSAVNFMYYLGVSPAAALVNLSQTAITTFPTLAAKYGAVRAMQETSRAMAAALRTGGNIERTAANEQERQALQALQDMGAIDKTLAHDLAGIGDADSRDFSPMWRKTMEFVSFLFHKAEVVNREASGLATFRMAIEDGKTFEQAVDEAADIIHGTHFNYSNANRARFMQGNAAKILFAFKQYSQNMTFYLWRSFYQGVKGASPEERSFARKQLLGTLGMTAIFSGVMGMPLLSLVFGIANAMAAVFGDDDEPFDAETEFRNWLADTLGPELSRIVQLGAIQGGLTALGLPAPSISERTSLNNLWLRDPDMELEGRDLYNYWLEQVAGPVGGMFAGAFRGYSMAKEGLETGDPSFLWRGAEAALPKAVRDAMKAIRYSVQGVNTLRGDPLVEDVSVAEWIIQANGFTPSRVMEAYEVNRSVKNYERAVMARRSALLDAYAIAHRERDTAMMRDTLDKIREFNRKHRSVAVSAETIRRSLASRRDYSERAMNGIVINRNLPQARDKGRFFDRE